MVAEDLGIISLFQFHVVRRARGHSFLLTESAPFKGPPGIPHSAYHGIGQNLIIWLSLAPVKAKKYSITSGHVPAKNQHSIIKKGKNHYLIENLHVRHKFHARESGLYGAGNLWRILSRSYDMSGFIFYIYVRVGGMACVDIRMVSSSQVAGERFILRQLQSSK